MPIFYDAIVLSTPILAIIKALDVRDLERLPRGFLVLAVEARSCVQGSTSW